ncbi:O-antigen translocase [Aliarcobacter butzleri]|uniref:O-antigen translocase n=1 Tax=Aliarcobacter butzleri TaxID=28197 RepID=UPI001EDAB59C|nr:O-antigen translocase [Aliarcobacter butzleri]MCG3656770.1 O-antigen translocase [Aliarcobacter butzleri]MDK2051439.1 O-antigen translocase [Aliarcobacter butzleri]
MTLIKTSLLTAIATAIKILNGLVVTKIIAIYIGPAGLALLASFQNFTSIVMTFATAGLNNGIVKYTAEYSSKIDKRRLWSTSIRISFIFTAICSFFIFIFNKQLSIYFFQTFDYKDIFTLFSITLFMFSLNTVLLSILNGQKEITKLTMINIFSSFVGLFLTGILTYYYNLYGALVSNVLGQTIVLLITIYFLLKTNWFKIKMFIGKIDNDELKKLSHFFLMALVSALTIPISQIIIRNYISDNLSLEDAGYWEAIWRISSTFTMFITTILTVYYLPKLASLKTDIELKNELFYGFKIIIPLTLFCILFIYILKDFIILVLFTKDFLPIKELFFYQLLGDLLKIVSFLVSYLMLAKVMTKLYIYSQIIFSLFFIFLSMFFVKVYGLIGVTMAYFFNYLVYFFVMNIVFRRILFARKV